MNRALRWIPPANDVIVLGHKGEIFYRNSGKRLTNTCSRWPDLIWRGRKIIGWCILENCLC